MALLIVPLMSPDFPRVNEYLIGRRSRHSHQIQSSPGRFSVRIVKGSKLLYLLVAREVAEAFGMAGFRLPMKPNCQVPGLASADETSRRVPVPRSTLSPGPRRR